MTSASSPRHDRRLLSYIRWRLPSAALRSYLSKHGQQPVAFARWLILHTSGDLLAIEYVLAGIERGWLADDPPYRLPQSLMAFYDALLRATRRQYLSQWPVLVEPVLATILVVRRPISALLLAALAGVADVQAVEQILSAFYPAIISIRIDRSGTTGWCLFDSSFRDHVNTRVVPPDERIDLLAAERRICDHFWLRAYPHTANGK